MLSNLLLPDIYEIIQNMEQFKKDSGRITTGGYCRSLEQYRRGVGNNFIQASSQTVGL